MNAYDSLQAERIPILSYTMASQQKEHDRSRNRLRARKKERKKPSPGTIYPVLKNMKEKKLLSIDENKRYTLTKNGKKNLEAHLDAFIRTFYDIDEMRSCCCEERHSSKER